MNARVIVASNRAWAGVYADSSGPILVAGLRQLGFEVPDPIVVPDGEPVGEALREAVAAGVDAVITSGGTGINPTDRTPDVTRAVLDYEIPGIAEAIRAYSRDRVPTSALSRGPGRCGRPHRHRERARLGRRGPGRAGRARPAAGPRGGAAARRGPRARASSGRGHRPTG